MKRILFLTALVCSAFPCYAGKEEVIPPLVSHQAVYNLSLKSTSGGASSVVHAAGKLQYTAQKVCRDWKTNTVFSLDVSYELNGVDTTHWKQTTVENVDGCRFNFAVYSYQKGKDTKDLEGKAWCDGKKKKILLTYPLKSEAEFPYNVFFPVQQTYELLKAAMEGKKNLSSYVYDGSRLEGLHFMNAVISPAGAPDDISRVKGDVSLLAGKSYWFDAAFYNSMGLSDTDDGHPFYEAGLKYYENGISDNVIQDFGVYKLQSRLASITKLPDIPCPSKKK